MLIYAVLIIAILVLLIRIVVLEKQNARLSYNYEDKILIILNDIKQIENKYATSGTEMCKYLENTISYHNRMYYKYKNKLNIADNA